MILFWGLQSWEPFLIISLPTLGSYSAKNYDMIPATKGSEEVSVYLLLKKLFFFPISHPNQFALLLCLQTLHILDWKEHYKRSCRPTGWVQSLSLCSCFFPLFLALSSAQILACQPSPLPGVGALGIALCLGRHHHIWSTGTLLAGKGVGKRSKEK